MSTGAIIILAVAAVVIVALVLARPAMSTKSGGLRRRFGPEYDRTLARHDGDTKAAGAELRERVRRHGHLRERPLSPEEREQYVAQWAGVQEQFVDSPAAAVAAADQLLDRLARDRGYPSDAHDDQVAALSVHRAAHIDGYRRMHQVAGRAREGTAHTEELREALVQARELFEQLVAGQPQDDGDVEEQRRERPGRRMRVAGRRHPGRARTPHTPWAHLRRGGPHSTKGA